MLSLDQTSRLNQSLNVSMTQVDVEELTAGSVKSRLRAACILFCRNDLVRREGDISRHSWITLFLSYNFIKNILMCDVSPFEFISQSCSIDICDQQPTRCDFPFDAFWVIPHSSGARALLCKIQIYSAGETGECLQSK